MTNLQAIRSAWNAAGAWRSWNSVLIQCEHTYI